MKLFFFILQASAPDLGSFAEKATLIGVLGAFCWYFLSKLGKMEEKRDQDYKLFLEKHEQLISNFFEENKRTTEAVNALAASMDKLADKIDDLK
jgi:hypothetical protein